MDALGELAVDAGIRDRRLHCTIKCSDQDIFDFLQDLLAELQNNLTGMDDNPVAVHCLLDRNIRAWKKDFLNNHSIFYSEHHRCVRMKKPEMTLAAALKYDTRKDAAPKVIAKGRGTIAERIIELAKKNNVPIKSDPGLVQILSKLDIDEQIPIELYKAVAEILAFVYSANNRYREHRFWIMTEKNSGTSCPHLQPLPTLFSATCLNTFNK